MDEEKRNEFDHWLNDDFPVDELVPPHVAERAAARAAYEGQQESNVEGIFAAFSLPQAPRANNI